MPKAMPITPENVRIIENLSGWTVEHLDDVLEKPHFYAQNVQFPHGFVDHVIVTKATFEATFKLIELSETHLTEVNYL